MENSSLVHRNEESSEDDENYSEVIDFSLFEECVENARVCIVNRMAQMMKEYGQILTSIACARAAAEAGNSDEAETLISDAYDLEYALDGDNKATQDLFDLIGPEDDERSESDCGEVIATEEE